MKIRNTTFAILLVAVSVLLAPMYGPLIHARAAAATSDDLEKDMQSVAAAFALVEKNFADTVSSERAFYTGAIPGMLHTLDPHSNFVDPAEYKEMQRRQKAQYFGVGMQITMDGPKVVVMEPFPGSPAGNADLRRGDVISAVDGKDTTGMDSDRRSCRMRDRTAPRPASHPAARSPGAPSCPTAPDAAAGAPRRIHAG